MHVVIAAKQVLDPEGVNSYALWGRLEVDETGRQFTISDRIPQIINAYDEQGMEAALRLRDADPGVKITAVSVGRDSAEEVLKRCVAMGADKALLVRDSETAAADGFRTARLLGDAIRELGDVDLVICGRQGSDYDQGTVPAALAEALGASYVTLASNVSAAADGVRVTRATPAGSEVVEAALPAVITVSNELGTPRYPTSRGMMEARRTKPTVVEGGASSPDDSGVELLGVSVPEVTGACEVVGGATPAEKAEALWQRLVTMGVFE